MLKNYFSIWNSSLGYLVISVRQRPEFLPRVVDAIDVLQVNLPPTLGTSQVKAVRKELKMHLIRLMKLPSIVPHVNKISTLLSDLGASQAVSLLLYFMLMTD